MASLITQVKSKLFIHSTRKSLHALDGGMSVTTCVLATTICLTNESTVSANAPAASPVPALSAA